MGVASSIERVMAGGLTPWESGSARGLEDIRVKLIP